MKSRLCTRHSEGTMFLQDVVIELGNRGVRSPSSSSSGRHCLLSASHIASSRRGATRRNVRFLDVRLVPDRRGVVVFGNCGRRAVAMGDCLHYRRGRSWNAEPVGGAESPDPAPGGRIPRV